MCMSLELHAALAGLPAMDEIDRVFCVGPLSKNLWQALPAEKRGKWQPTVADILSDVRRDLRAGDVLLVKGSKATGLSALVDAIRKMGHGAPQ